MTYSVKKNIFFYSAIIRCDCKVENNIAQTRNHLRLTYFHAKKKINKKYLLAFTVELQTWAATDPCESPHLVCWSIRGSGCDELSHWTLSTIDFCHSTLCASFSALPEWISFGLVAFSKLCCAVYEAGSSKNQNLIFCARIWLDMSAVKKPWKTPLKSVIDARSCFKRARSKYEYLNVQACVSPPKRHVSKMHKFDGLS